jgi:hypothetical protein
MPYTKPEINALGDASRVIKGNLKCGAGIFDPEDFHFNLCPAYDLDE